jgi:hypothetical protein
MSCSTGETIKGHSKRPLVSRFCSEADFIISRKFLAPSFLGVLGNSLFIFNLIIIIECVIDHKWISTHVGTPLR